jgi:hypothetical protein
VSKGLCYDDDLKLLDSYVNFCVKSLNDFLLAAKLEYGTDHWDVDDETPSNLLRPTSINGLIACLRRVIEGKFPLSYDEHKKRLKGLSSIKFGSYKSSRWDALGEALFEKHYKESGS